MSHVDEVVGNVLERAKEALASKRRAQAYFNDPVLFAKDVLGVHLWSKQQEITGHLVGHKRTLVKAGHGVGKSHLAAVLAIWWVATRGADPEQVLVVSTAPTYAQVHGVLWENIRAMFNLANQRYEQGLTDVKLPGYITQGDVWKTDDGVQIGFGRKPADGANSAFQGFHKQYTLVLIDEAVGVPQELWEAIDAITTSDDCRILAIANPTDPATYFGELFRKKPKTPDGKQVWAEVTIGLQHSPHFTKQYVNDPTSEYYEAAQIDKDLPKEAWERLTPVSWAEDMIAQHGEDSPVVQARVYAEFPEQGINTLFTLAVMNKGFDTVVDPLVTETPILGVDIARFGPDFSVIYRYDKGLVLGEQYDGSPGRKPTGTEGGKLRFVASLAQADAIETAHWINSKALEVGAKEVRIDAEGLGATVCDYLARFAEGNYAVVEIRGSAVPPDKARWYNNRAYMYDNLRQNMFDGKIDIDPNDRNLEEELMGIQYHFKNRYAAKQIESKEDMQRRGVKSPDFADAAVYAAADLSHILDNPLGGITAGDRISIDVNALLGFVGSQANYIGPY